jgi:hypothetical protein
VKTLTKLAHIVFLLLAPGLFSAGALGAESAGERAYALPGHGSLLLRMPLSWNDELRQHPGNFPPTIVLTGFEGSPFEVMLTPQWANSHNATEFGTAKSIYDIVAKAAQAVAAESLEGKTSIVTIGGGQGPGYYFDATDRAPKPGDYKYLTQGAIGVGELICTFTILTNDNTSVTKNKVLNMVTRASWRPGR